MNKRYPKHCNDWFLKVEGLYKSFLRNGVWAATQKSIIAVALTCIFSSVHAFQPDSTIDLTITKVDTGYIELSWNSPRGALSCSIIYETAHDSTSIPITNFALDSARIPRSLPHGNVNDFTIIFQVMGPGGIASIGDIEKTIYGGVIIVNEDIFQSTITITLDSLAPDEITYFFLFERREGSIVCDHDAFIVESTVFQALIKEIDPADEITVAAWEKQLRKKIERGTESGAFEGLSWPCPEAPSQLQAAVLQASPRIGSDHELAFLCYPNPFHHHLTIAYYGEEEEVKVRVLNSLGKVVYEQHSAFHHNKHSCTIPTADWVAGLYHIQIIQDNTATVYKHIKY